MAETATKPRPAASQQQSDDAAPVSSDHGKWVADGVVYLTERGWHPAGLDKRNLPLFTDPQSATKSEVRVGASLPNREGEPTIVKQMHVGRAQWDFTIEDALYIARARENTAKK